MSKSKVHLATTSKDIALRADAARKRGHEKVILVPVDFSDHSKSALLYASELTAALSAAMVVLHVVHDPGEMPGYYSKLIKKKRAGRIQDTAAEVFDDFMDAVIDERPDLGSLQIADRLMVVGLPVTRILEVANKIDPDMLVIGSQGRTGLKNVLIGSKAAQIVQLSPVPVTVVKSAKPATPD
jgi:nucleotide-binding universal stress UspA family protein